MTIEASSAGAGSGSPALRVVSAGIVGAAVDALFGIVTYVVILDLIGPGRFFQSVAAGLLGREAARAGGAPTVALGVGLHFAIGCIWATVYHFALKYGPGLRRRAASLGGTLAAGVAFGALIWLVMDFVVLPLSAARHTPVSSWHFWVQLLGHALLVGPAIALALRPGREGRDEEAARRPGPAGA